MTVEERFWDQVDKTDPNGCWLWTSSTIQGYGMFTVTTGVKQRRTMHAHRWSYVEARGPIPEGLELDHLCMVRNCVRPDHLEAVTHAENLARSNGICQLLGERNECIQGHAFDEANTYRKPGGGRQCKTCRRATDARRRARNKTR